METHCLWKSLESVSIERLVVTVTVTYFELMLGSMDADMFVNIFGVEFRYLTAVS